MTARPFTPQRLFVTIAELLTLHHVAECFLVERYHAAGDGGGVLGWN